jgi:fatty-acyl-CoA synthase
MFEQIPDITAQRAQLTPDAIAFRDLVRGSTRSYAELETSAQRAAGLMSSLGIDAGDRIAILCRNRIEFFELLFACAKLGAVLVPLNWRMPAGELQPLVDDAAPKVLFHGEEDRAVAAEIEGSGLHRVDFDEPGEDGYSARRLLAGR